MPQIHFPAIKKTIKVKILLLNANDGSTSGVITIGNSPKVPFFPSTSILPFHFRLGPDVFVYGCLLVFVVFLFPFILF